MNTHPKIVTIGSMTLDLFVKPKDAPVVRFFHETGDGEKYMALPYGSKMTVDDVCERYGGGAQNTAVGLARLGFDTLPLGAIGTDTWGDRILENLKKENVSPDHLLRSNEQKTGFSVIVSSFEGERTVLYHAGANRDFVDFDEKVLDECDGIFFNHISARGADADQVFQKIKRHFLRYPEKFLAWNPGKEQLSQGALAFADFFPVVDILLLNKEESELFTNRKAGLSIHEQYKVQKGTHFCPEGTNEYPHYAADYNEIFRVFIEQGVQHIAITDGRKGAQLCDGKHIYFSSILENAPRVDTLGAGDAFGSGLFYALFHQKQLSSALKYATINAASVVSGVGAQTGLMVKKDLQENVKKASLLQTQTKCK